MKDISQDLETLLNEEKRLLSDLRKAQEWVVRIREVLSILYNPETDIVEGRISMWHNASVKAWIEIDLLKREILDIRKAIYPLLPVPEWA